MIQVQPFERLGRFRNEWLNARHHFNFGQYRDQARGGIGGLVVWNDDEIAPGKGFEPHPHRDMEIVTYVREGAITHKDSLGNQGRTEAGDVQVMHAGTGIVHGEWNLEDAPTRLFQIWIQPNRMGVAPGWGSRVFPKGAAGALTPLADGRPGADGTALPLYADAAVLAGTVRKGQTVRQALAAGRVAYLVAATGAMTVNGVAANTRDGVTVSGEAEIVVTATEDAEVVMVDVVGESGR
jgi:redox-sensitive bicupin YhaK (pirin superfamily)